MSVPPLQTYCSSSMVIVIVFNDLLLYVIILFLILPLVQYVLIATESVVMTMATGLFVFFLLLVLRCSSVNRTAFSWLCPSPSLFKLL
jgi:hypothetical protein